MKIWGAWALLVSAAILYANPTLFQNTTLLKKLKPQSLIWNSVVFEKRPSREPFLMYRQSPQREAQFSLKHTPATAEWLTPRFNVGIHSASKASIIGDHTLYAGGDDSFLRALSLQGEMKWQAYLADSPFGIHSTPALDQTSLFVGTYRGALYRFDKDTGQLLWMRILGHTIGASPLIDQNTLTVAIETHTANGYLIKLDASSGAILWQSEELGEQAHSSPSLDATSSTLVIGVNNGSLQGFDYATGRRKWQTDHLGAIKATAWIHNGIGYVGTWNQNLIAFKVQTGEVLWQASFSAKLMASPAVLTHSQVIVACDTRGTVKAFALDDGKLKWEFSPPPFRQLSSPVVVKINAQEKVLLACAENKLCLLSAHGQVEKTWPLKGNFSGSPYVLNNAVYLSLDEGGVQKINLAL